MGIFLALHLTVSLYHSLFGLLECLVMSLTLTLRNQIHKLRKKLSNFYRRHFDLVSKFNTGLKSLLKQGISEPEFYGDLVYKFKKIFGRNDFSDQFRKIIIRYKRIGYNINVKRQTACLVVNPITVNNFADLFNCTARLLQRKTALRPPVTYYWPFQYDASVVAFFY